MIRERERRIIRLMWVGGWVGGWRGDLRERDRNGASVDEVFFLNQLHTWLYIYMLYVFWFGFEFESIVINHLAKHLHHPLPLPPLPRAHLPVRQPECYNDL